MVRGFDTIQKLKVHFQDLVKCVNVRNIYIVEILQPSFFKAKCFDQYFTIVADKINSISQMLNPISKKPIFTLTLRNPEFSGADQVILTESGLEYESIVFDYNMTPIQVLIAKLQFMIKHFLVILDKINVRQL
jgi:hypothetical protein